LISSMQHDHSRTIGSHFLLHEAESDPDGSAPIERVILPILGASRMTWMNDPALL